MRTKNSYELITKLRASYNFSWQFALQLFEYLEMIRMYPTLFNNWENKFNSKEYITYILKGEASLEIFADNLELIFLKSKTTSILEDEKLIQTLQEYDNKTVEETLLYFLDQNNDFREESSTPQSIIDLVLDVYFNGKKETFLDVCSGTGTMLFSAKEKGAANQYLGIEIIEDNYVKSIIKLNLGKASDFIISHANVFDQDNYVNNKNIKADYIFCNYPIGLINYDEVIDLKFGLEKSLPIQKIRREDYKFISYVYDHLKENGKGIIVVSGNILFNAVEMDIRKHLVENKLIESVIQLPDRLFERTSISTYLLVVSYNNENIKMIDLTPAVSNTRRHRNDIDVDLAKSIISDLESIHQKTVQLEEIEKEQYSLIPSLYLRKEKLNLKNLSRIEDVAEIFSGWQVSSQTLNEIYQVDPKDIDQLTQIVQISDITDGFLEISNKFYQVEEKYLEKFRVQKGDVVISTKSQVVKSAVIDEDLHKNTIASGSIIVIRPENNKIDPYYLKAFLESQIGQQLLSLRMTGNIIKNLTVNNVKTLDVPIIEIKKQIEIGENFIQKKQLIEVQKNKILRLQDEIERLFEFVTEGD
jgi:type I restriction-modification system DNA methylase subunit